MKDLVAMYLPNWSTHSRSRSEKISNSRFLNLSQAFSLLLLVLSTSYFITNLKFTAGDQVFPMSPEQPVLLLIPDFTFCSVFTKIHPMEVVRLFAWFPEGVTRQDKCFLRCMLRKWGLFIDSIGEKWDTIEVSKYLLSISSTWRRSVEASSAIYLCKLKHNNMTTKYGCKNAFNFFLCLYNNGMSFLLTEKDISDYRMVYEARHPYPVEPEEPDSDEEYEEEDETELGSTDNNFKGKSKNPSGSKTTVTTSQNRVNRGKTTLSTSLENEVDSRQSEDFNEKKPDKLDNKENIGRDYDDLLPDEQEIKREGINSSRDTQKMENNTEIAGLNATDQLSNHSSGSEDMFLSSLYSILERENNSLGGNRSADSNGWDGNYHYSPNTSAAPVAFADHTLVKNGEGFVKDHSATRGQDPDKTGFSVSSNKPYGQSRSTSSSTNQTRKDPVTNTGSELEDTNGETASPTGKNIDERVHTTQLKGSITVTGSALEDTNGETASPTGKNIDERVQTTQLKGSITVTGSALEDTNGETASPTGKNIDEQVQTTQLNGSITVTGSALEDTNGETASRTSKNIDERVQVTQLKDSKTVTAGDATIGAVSSYDKGFTTEDQSNLNDAHANRKETMVDDSNATSYDMLMSKNQTISPTPVVASNSTAFDMLNSTGYNSTSSDPNLKKDDPVEQSSPILETTLKQMNATNATIKG